MNIRSVNSIALIAEKAMRTGVNLLVFATLARSFGPEGLGLFGLMQAIFFLGVPLARVINEQIIIKYLVSEKSEPFHLNKVVFKLKYAGAVLVYSVTLLAGYIYFDSEFTRLLALFCLLHFLNIDVVYFAHFRAKQNSLTVLKGTACVVLPGALLKIWSALYFQDLFIVVWCYVLEAGTLSFLARRLFREYIVRDSSVVESEKAHTTALTLLKSSWPIFTSAFLVILYSRLDLLMINSMLTKVDVGYYTAVAKISEASTVVMTAFLASRLPLLLKAKEKSAKAFRQEIIKLLRLSILFSLVTTICIHLFGDLVLGLLYGKPFEVAATTLTVHFAGSLFLYQGFICSQWLLSENLQIFRLYRVLSGLLLNLILNFLLIPGFGIFGAAVATFITQLFSSVLFNALNKKTLPIFSLQIKSFWFQKPPTA